MIFFDLFYFLLLKFYSRHKEKGAQSTSAGIVGSFQSLNLITGVLLIEFITGQESNTGIHLVLVAFILFQATTYYRYIFKGARSIKVIERKWNHKTEKSRTKIRITLFLYGAISIIGSFGLAIYLQCRN